MRPVVCIAGASVSSDFENRAGLTSVGVVVRTFKLNTLPNMPSSAHLGYRFNGFRIDPVRRLLFGADGEPIPLKPKVFDTLLYLVERPGVLVDKQALLEAVWPHVVVEENNLNKAISTLRQVFGETRDEHRFIVTEPGRGYRFVAQVEAVRAVTTEQPPAGLRPLSRRRRMARRLRPPGIHPRVRRGTVSRSGPRLMLALRPSQLVSRSGCDRRLLARTGERTESADIPRESLCRTRSPSAIRQLSPDPDDAYFAAGMQDEIVEPADEDQRAARVLRAAGPGAQRPIQDIGRDLNVATVLGGSVRYSEGRVRVTPRLTQARTSENLWSDSYERERSDIFAIQSDIALDVAHELNLELSAVERERIERVPTTNPQARDLYIMARARNPTRRAEVLLAIDEIEQALKLDPEFKEAWVLDSDGRSGTQRSPTRNADEDVGFAASKRPAERWNSTRSRRGHAALGLALGERDWTGAEKDFRRAKSSTRRWPDWALTGSCN